MRPFKANTRGNDRGPEAIIQRKIIAYLEKRGWFVKVTHGNAYASGWPDLWITHKLHGPKWVEVKNAEYWVLTPAQLHDFPLMIQNGTPIWVMIGPTDLEYSKLFRECNYHDFHDAGVRGYSNIYDYREDLKNNTLRPIEIDVELLKHLEDGDGEGSEL